MTGYEKLRVDSPYPIKVIQDVRLEWKPNEHGKLVVSGLVDDSQQMNAVKKAAVGDTIRLLESDESGEHTIFSGLISAARTVHRAGVYTLEFEALSGTSVLDVQKKRRSFQNEKMTYEALIKAVLAPYSGADAIVLEGGGKPIGEPIVQYDETDWEFLKRIASHSQTVVISDILEAKPRIHIGVPKLESIELPIDIPYTVSNNTLQYQRANATQQGLQEQDFFQYEIHSGHRYRIGNEAQFRKKQMVVSGVRAAMDKGQFIYTYRLGRRNGIRQNQIHNKKLVGISVDGKVLDVKESLVKLHLTMDKEQPKSTAYWFPFTPPTGNVMYCMPQIGTNATLYFPNDAGGKAKVTGCVRTNGGSCGKTGNPNNRYFGTEHGSELEITPTAINITSGSQEPLKISIDDEQGIILTSHRKLTLHAVDDISLYTPKRIIIRTPNMVVAKRLSKLSGFTIESEYHVLGDLVHADGRDRTSYPKYNDEPATWEGPKVEEPKEEEQEGKKKKKFSWGKLLVAVAVVAVVVAVSVATLGAGTVAGAVAGAALIGAVTGAAATVGTMVANDIARGEMSSAWEYIESAATGIIVGAIGGAIFGPFGGSVATSLVPATTGQVVRQLATNVGIGFMSSYTDYTLTELINGRSPNFVDAVTAGLYGSLFAGGFAALAPVAGFLKVGAQKATQHGVDWFKNLNLQDNIRRSMKELANNIPNPFKNIQNRLAFNGAGNTTPYRFDMEDYRRSGGGGGGNGGDRSPETRSGSGGSGKPPNRIYDENGNPLPFGFSSVKQYNDLVNSLKQELPEGTQILFQGSSVTGVSHKKGLPFDQGRVSDFDIALVNDDLFLEALEIGRGGGFKMKTDPNRIGPLDEKQLEILGLLEIVEKKSKEAGRPVSFMLYESVEQALKRPSLMVTP